MSSFQLQRMNSTDAVDKYTEGIDFSNACREFYMNRVKATESFKKKMNTNSESRKPEAVPRKKSSIESAMEKLRHEMVIIYSIYNLTLKAKLYIYSILKI